ncbi:MAG: Sua5/YciO/YrdC/YwlC family protein [Phycisphaerae bacterium]|nr:Sua5/YciO/YrdC/YwlC family protein [Phycisphaerae bacterium]
MHPEVIDVRAPGDPSGAVERAGRLLSSGRVVVLATETVYGVAASASAPGALDELWRIKGPGRRAPLAWHLHSSIALTEALSSGSIVLTPLQRRAIRVLTPGPVTFAIGASGEQLASIRAKAGVSTGVFDDGSELLVRVPDRRVTREVIERAGVPVVIGSLGGVRLAQSAQDAAEMADGAALILDDGPPTYEARSTLIRLGPEGGYEVAREGALPGRIIRRRMARTLLFVCTGNTCRSPMAAAIARHLLAAGGSSGIETRVKSAGTSAGFGMEATPEGVEALRDIGIEMGRHSSAPLTREMLNEAEVVFGMTRSHVESILRLDPGVRDRVFLLDPSGADIADPIGSPRRVYDEVASLLRRAIEQRLKELPE